MNAPRIRRLTDPAGIAASAAFDAALTRAKKSKVWIAEQLGVTPGLVSQWANCRVSIPAERAQAVAALVGTSPEDISPEWRTIAARIPASQPARLDPQKMAEALVAVLKMQEKDRREFRPKQTAIALCAMYEVRGMFPDTMTVADLSTFDNMVQAALNRAWEQDGHESDRGTAADGRNRDPQPTVKRKRA